MDFLKDTYSDIEVIDFTSDTFPKELKQISMPPKRLYCTGKLELLNNPKKVALVGSRKMSTYGEWVTDTISAELSESGVTIVSGMAMGVDAVAHKAAMDKRGNTIAVLGCGVDICYPAINRGLYEKLKKTGLIVSEYPPQAEVRKWTFPERNRIIAGLCELTIVTEAGLNSGALITAELAMDANRRVMAVPANINSSYSIGSNKLIYDGAEPIVVIDDALRAVGVNKKRPEQKGLNLGEDEKEIYAIVNRRGEISIERICMETGYTPAYINAIVTILEMKGAVATSLGKVIVLK